MNYTIEELMVAWGKAAEELWERVVKDTHKGQEATLDKITGIFKGVGWSFWVPGGYVEKGGRNAWCGHTQGLCGLSVGDYLEPGQCVPVMLDFDIVKNVTPSTARLNSAAKWRKAGYEKPDYYTGEDVERIIDSDSQVELDDLEEFFSVPRLATISARDYGDARNEYGGHVVLIVGFDREARTFETIEGNAHGILGDGTWGEGVIRRRGEHARPLSVLRRVYELEAIHFEVMEAGDE